MALPFTQKLSPFTITVDGETFDVPTYAVSKDQIPDLLEMAEGEKVILNDQYLVQRGVDMHSERWFLYDGEEWFSLRLVY